MEATAARLTLASWPPVVPIWGRWHSVVTVSYVTRTGLHNKPVSYLNYKVIILMWNPIIIILSELHVNTHAYIPYQVWSTLVTMCTQLTCLEMTSCEGLWDGSLASLLEKYPQCLSKMTRYKTTTSDPPITFYNTTMFRLCIRGNHRGDISLTERSVSLVRRRCPDLVQLGDCFTWSMAGVASTGQRIWGPVQRAGSRGL